ncbi:hypothetical protein BJF90_23670 [Pseudonocardia sp. CNS-004]|nr:hypothetical protein BJF90_23670 [Pseudonocardia sp. CNS-004]
MRILHRFYGAGAGHLLGIVVCLVLAVGAVAIVVDDPAWPRMLVWFLAAVALHDFVLFPLYAAGDRLLTGRKTRTTAAARRRPRVPVVNHVRLPLLGAGLTFLLFLPGILGRNEPTLRSLSGLDPGPVAGRWLLLVATMVAVSALVYLVRVLRARSVSTPAGDGG